MKYLAICLFCLLLVPPAAAAEAPAAFAGKKIYGVVEPVVLPDIGSTPVKAKLDTGADTSSLGAHKIKVFEKNGTNWVRFTPQLNGAAEMELPLFRSSRIKRRAGDGGEASSLRRPVVLLNVCFDGKAYQIEVNLTDRSRFEYPLLLGSSALITVGAAVDPSLSDTIGAVCP